MDDIAKEMDLLLNNFWITKDDDKDNYYLLKRRQGEIKNFVSKNLGNKLIVHDRFIKLEKIPALARPELGIKPFVRTLDYVILFIFLLYLEDKPHGEKFILSSLIQYIKNSAITLELSHIPNWDLSVDRRSLARVMDYLLNLKIIVLKDADKQSFADNKDADALYEITGLSNYLVPAFDCDIYDCKNAKDFLNKEWGEQSLEKGDVRRYKVYRNLLYLPAVSSFEITDSEYDYLKKMHKMIKKELTDNLDLETEITRNMALVYAEEKSLQKEYFPNNKRISDIVLIINKKIIDFIKEKEITMSDKECFFLPQNDLMRILKETRDEEKQYFSKQYLTIGFDKYADEVIDYMKDFGFIKETGQGYYVFPIVYRFIGKLVSNQKNENEQLNLLEGDVNEI